MIRSELVKQVAAASGLTQQAAEEAVAVILETMEDTLRRGDRVELRGFGSFSIRQREARTGRNPRNGTSVEVAEKAYIHFKPSLGLHRRLNGKLD